MIVFLLLVVIVCWWICLWVILMVICVKWVIKLKCWLMDNVLKLWEWYWWILLWLMWLRLRVCFLVKKWFCLVSNRSKVLWLVRWKIMLSWFFLSCICCGELVIYVFMWNKLYLNNLEKLFNWGGCICLFIFIDFFMV